MNQETGNSWRLERRLPPSLLLALASQLAALLIWATHLDSRVEQVEMRQKDANPLAERFARLEVRLDSLKEDMAHLRQQIDKMAQAAASGHANR